MKRSRLRKVSKKRAKLIRAVGKDRLEFLMRFDRCAFPGCMNQPTCVHEIAFGSGIRAKAFGSVEAWLPSCAEHNYSGQGFHDPSALQIVDQCAVKRHVDPQNYSLFAINEIRHHAQTSITEQEVDAAHERVYNNGTR